MKDFRVKIRPSALLWRYIPISSGIQYWTLQTIKSQPPQLSAAACYCLGFYLFISTYGKLGITSNCISKYGEFKLLGCLCLLMLIFALYFPFVKQNLVCNKSVSGKVCGLNKTGNFFFFFKHLQRVHPLHQRVACVWCARSLSAKPLWACWVRVCCSQRNWTEAAPDIASGQQMGLAVSLLYGFLGAGLQPLPCGRHRLHVCASEATNTRGAFQWVTRPC